MDFLDDGAQPDLDPGTAVGWVPTEGRGSAPFSLLHGESLVAVATWSLGQAGVEPLDFTTSWEELQARDAALVLHDPLCAGTPSTFLAEAVASAVADDVVVVGVRPVTDTVTTVVDGHLGKPVDRDGLRAVTSPVVLPASVVGALAGLPVPADGDPADLVAALVETLGADRVVLLEGPPEGRRILDDSDLRLVEALLSPPDPG